MSRPATRWRVVYLVNGDEATAYDGPSEAKARGAYAVHVMLGSRVVMQSNGFLRGGVMLTVSECPAQGPELEASEHEHA